MQTAKPRVVRPTPPQENREDGTTASTATARSTEGNVVATQAWAVHWVYPAHRVNLLDAKSWVIGRDAEQCNFALSDSEISRRHCEFVESGGTRVIRDLSSRNGTSVDGHRVAEARLGDGSVIRVGTSVGVVVCADDSALAPAVLGTLDGGDSIGSGKLKAVLERATAVATRPEPVLINGESGTGKEQIAHLIHRVSGRTGAYVPVNCSTLRGDLARDALFGHVKGAFSGAAHANPGAIRSAENGTLFLDEIAELPLEIQPMLLRFLESGEVTPVGSHSVTAHVRVVSATHRDLTAACEAGRFREDLFYRLATHRVHLPPLRVRRQDILPIFCHYLMRPLTDLSAGFVVRLLLHPWHGNVRELRNVALSLSAGLRGEPLRSRHLDSHLAVALPGQQTLKTPKELSYASWKALFQTHHGVAAEIARATGIPESTVKRYLKRHRLRETS